MTIPTKNLQNGFEIPVYGLGTWGMGGTYSIDTSHDKEDIQAIQAAIDLGITHIDTAEIYAQGHSEELVGEAIKDYHRSKLFLVSKVYKDNLRYDDVITACKNSLNRLQTDYLDLYLTHRFNPKDIPVKETMKALDTLVEQGLVKHIGFCNYNVEEIKEAQSYTHNKLVAAQLHLNLKYREAEHRGVLKYCQENDIMFIAWRPVQKGVLLQNQPEVLKTLMKKYDKSASEIAINWLISQKNVVTLSKTTSIKHLKENLGALDFEMEKEDIEKLKKEFPNQESISDTAPLN